MAFTNDEIKKVAHLARLDMSDEELASLKSDLDAIMDWIEQLKEVNTEGVEPMLNACDYDLPIRKDEVKMNNTREDVMTNAPERGGEKKEYFSVHKMV